MKLHCPHCGVKGSADDSYRGRKVKCPKCEGVFEVILDVPAELSEEVDFYSDSSTASSPGKSSVAGSADALLYASKEGAEQYETTQSPSIDAAVEEIDFADEPAESSPEFTAPAQELAEEVEPLNWDDLTSEIELQIAESERVAEREEIVAEREEIQQESPVDVSSFQNEFDQPTAEETVAPEIVAIAGNYNEDTAEDEGKPAAEKDEIELELSDSDITAEATDGSNGKFSLVATIKNAWAKVKDVLFS